MLLSTDATYPAFRGSLSKASWTALPRASSLIPSNNFITSWGWVGCSCGWGFAQLRADRLEWGAPKLQDATMVTLFFTTCTKAIAFSLSLSCLYILSVILVGRILYYYHRFLLKYTLFWYHGGIRINSSPLTTSRTCRCQDRGTTSCFLLHSHRFIVLLKSRKKIDISWWIQKTYEPEPTEYIKKIMIQVLCHSLKRTYWRHRKNRICLIFIFILN